MDEKFTIRKMIITDALNAYKNKIDALLNPKEIPESKNTLPLIPKPIEDAYKSEAMAIEIIKSGFDKAEIISFPLANDKNTLRILKTAFGIYSEELEKSLKTLNALTGGNLSEQNAEMIKSTKIQLEILQQTLEKSVS